MTPSSDMPRTDSRLDLVDALRGFAIVSIMLLHNIEHFDLYFSPPGEPAWLKGLGQHIWDAMFALFGGKSYAIFALLFGLTFHLQYDARARRGEDFRPRFAWRMLLLLGFGLVNSAFYHGDILSIYAVLGLVLIPVARLGTRTVFLLACFLSLQPFAWIDALAALDSAPGKLPDPESWSMFGRANQYLMHGSVLDVWIGNLTNGKHAVVLWSWEMGRVLQIPGLFMFGMLAGRLGLFAVNDRNIGIWRRIFFGALLLLGPLFFIHSQLETWIAAEALRRPVASICNPLLNLDVMLLLVTGFALLFRRAAGASVLGKLRWMGRMSLTSYMMQSIVGTTLYYGFGFGLYAVAGTVMALSIGIVLAVLQGTFSAWWLKSHKQGPLETVWHRLTWIGAASTQSPQPATRVNNPS
ncbi:MULTISPECIES: DUF418 domain-containing protein [unclassified Massilia]|uniref:DUF418 domain-containing protein n=1 Tax=unclassified Massilia TaxID=2609279 RepID=UPI000AEFB5AD|nr:MULTISPECIES: DUF418 domain-containing protein [unclassified Massilia]